MSHRTLIKIHGFIAVFFLPMAILYAVTGSLYILGESGTASTTVVRWEGAPPWPEERGQALAMTNALLSAEGLPEVKRLVQPRRLDDGSWLWRGMDKNVTLVKDDGSGMSVRLQEHDLFRRLVEVHKNHAGILFSIFGVAFGLAMTVLILSGAYMMFTSRLYRKSASGLMVAGVTTSALVYLATLHV